MFLDYGCGKGRACYYLSWQCRCRCIGVEHDDRIFFFNPFSVEVLQAIMKKILDSWFDEPREILLFFYYPSDCRRERVMVFVIRDNHE